MEYRLSIDVRTALAAGAGGQSKGGIVPLARDVDGVPCIPASTLKGALRASLDRVIRGSTSGEPRCTRSKVSACNTAGCPVCALFGTAGRPGLIRLSDARIVDEALRGFFGPQRRGSSSSELRVGQPLDRGGRLADPNSAAARETTGAGGAGLRLTARLETMRALSDAERSLLEAAVRSVVGLGGGVSRGLGHVKLEIDGPVPVRETPESRTSESMRVILTAREPFATARASGGAPLTGGGGDFVPGVTLRGAFAHALAHALPGGFEHAGLAKALSSGGLSVTDAIPAGRRVAPATLVTCNAYPGFHLHTGPKVPAAVWSHGAWDMLLVDFLARRLEEVRRWSWAGRCLLALDTGPCPGHLVPLSASYVTERVADEQVAPFAAVTARMSVDPASGRGTGRPRARLATLPTRGLSRYEARLSGADPEIAAALAGLSQVRIGGQSLVGHGTCSVRFEPYEPAPVRPALEALEEAVAKLLAKWPGGVVTRTEAGLERQRLVAIDLLSDWIPRRWASTAEETILADLPKMPGVEVLEARVTVGEVGGYNCGAGLPRTLRRAFCRRGVVLLSYQLIQEAAVVEILETLAKEGVGLDTCDGFGQVRICDPVHWERVPPLTEGR